MSSDSTLMLPGIKFEVMDAFDSFSSFQRGVVAFVLALKIVVSHYQQRI
jgi:hypothetical protein